MTTKRVLKVAAVGEHRRLNQKAQVRLEGKWLVKAGIFPEKHVEVTNPQKGVLILRVQE